MVSQIAKTFSEKLERCDFCPRKCYVNRLQNELGFCGTNAYPLVASVFLHFGEEPVISGNEGICNVFFAHCNLSCIYCQNYQITNNLRHDINWLTSYETIVERIITILEKGATRLGFVSPTHQVAQMVEIITRVNQEGFNPTIVYNTNSYDNPDVLRLLEGVVDVYLPDMKYFSNKLAQKYSNAPEYWMHSVAALKEMLWQKGTSLILDDNGYVTSGVIVRHLVLPNHSDDSIEIFRFIADCISSDINISLMSQYFPTSHVERSGNLSKTITREEYKNVADKLIEFGFYRIWQQELDSSEYYKPNFSQKRPF